MWNNRFWGSILKATRGRRKKEKTAEKAIDAAKKAEERFEKARGKAMKAAEEAGINMTADLTGITPPPVTDPMDVDNDAASTATPVAGVGKNAPSKWPHGRQQTLIAPNFCKSVAFYNVRFVVPASNRPMDEAIKKCKTLLKIF